MSAPGEMLPHGRVRVIELDFESKTDRAGDPSTIQRAMAEGRFVWIDVEARQREESLALLVELRLFPESILDDAFGGEPGTQLARYEHCLHLVVSGCRLTADVLSFERLDIILAERFLLTLHTGPLQFLERVHAEFRDDFRRFAKTPSFLIFEIWDHMIEHYVAIQKVLERRLEQLQSKLIDDVEDAVFKQVADVGSDLLHFRALLLPVRAILTKLGTRRSLLISEATQPFLLNMVGTLERVLQDVVVDRDILAQSLNLHMSMVAHRTNIVMSKLTIVSAIFLPLTFLCGVYGMNFDVLPELHWRFGYAFFWLAVLVIVFTLLGIMRRNRLL